MCIYRIYTLFVQHVSGNTLVRCSKSQNNSLLTLLSIQSTLVWLFFLAWYFSHSFHYTESKQWLGWSASKMTKYDSCSVIWSHTIAFITDWNLVWIRWLGKQHMETLWCFYNDLASSSFIIIAWQRATSTMFKISGFVFHSLKWHVVECILFLFGGKWIL